MAEIAQRVSLEEDSAYVGLVQLPSTAQRLVSGQRLPLPALLDDEDDISSVLGGVADCSGSA